MAGRAGRPVRLAVDPSFSLWTAALSHGWHGLAPFGWDAAAETLTRVERLSSGAVHVTRLRQAPDASDGRRALVLEVRPQPSADDLRELQRRARLMLRLDDDLTDFHDRCRRSPALRPIAQLGAGRLLRSPDLWEDVVKGICTTNVTWQRTRQMAAALTRLSPAPADGVDQRPFPTPREVLEAGAAYLTQEVRAGYRARSILALAEGAASGSIDFHALAEAGRPASERLAALEALPGIGPVTARYLGMLLGTYDELSIDSATRGFAVRTFGAAAADPAVAARRYRSFGRWRALAFWCHYWLGWERVRERMAAARA